MSSQGSKPQSNGLALVFGAVAAYSGYIALGDASAGQALSATGNAIVASAFGIASAQYAKGNLSKAFEAAKLGAYATGFGINAVVCATTEHPVMAVITGAISAWSAYDLFKLSRKP